MEQENRRLSSSQIKREYGTKAANKYEEKIEVMNNNYKTRLLKTVHPT